MHKLLISVIVLLQYDNALRLEMYSTSHWLGTPVHLECGALTPVDCSWKYNGRTMNIGNRYRYLFSNGTSATDCSIVIELFHEEDVGNWSCWSLSNDKFDGDLLASFALTIKLKQHSEFISADPGNTSSQIGLHVEFPCKFNIFQKECHWLRNGKPVAIVNRYKYVNYLASGYDCSMNITSVQDIDVGTWQCASSANNDRGYVVSRVGQLTVSGKDSVENDTLSEESNNTIVEHPYNTTVSIGNPVILPCKFQDPVECVWLRKEQIIHVGYRYSYVSNSNISKKADCSLKITNSQMIDEGQWRCVGAGDDRYAAISSNGAVISFNRNEAPTAIAEHPDDVIATYASNITLICSFNTSVNCDWSREGMSVKIGGRYNYTTSTNGMKTTDCSIVIHQVSEVDIGNWTCSSLLTVTNSYIENSQVSLSLLKTPTQIKIFVKGKDVSNSVVKLSNPKLGDVTCVAENGNPPPRLTAEFFTERFPYNNQSIPGVHELQLVGKNLYTARLHLNLTKFRSRMYLVRCDVGFPTNRNDFALAFLRIDNEDDLPLEIIQYPNDFILPVGDPTPINLTCKFNKPVQTCLWEFNSQLLDREKNYKFTDGSNGLNTSDCTITINTTLAVKGKWRCLSKDSQTGNILSRYAVLSVMTQPSLPTFRYYDTRAKNSSIFIHASMALLHLYCNSRNGNPEPKLHWLLDGKKFSNGYYSVKYDVNRSLESTEISAIIDRSMLVKNFTSLRCVLTHPGYPEPQMAEVMLIRNRRPIDPIIAVNDTLVKSNVTVITNSSTEVHCVSQAGSPAAYMIWELDGYEIKGFAETLTAGENLLTVILHWPEDFNWNVYNKSSMDLRCKAMHPEYEKPTYALAVVNFVVIKETHIKEPVKKRGQIMLTNGDADLKLGSSYIFQCQYSEAMICGMKHDNVWVDKLEPVSSVTWFRDDDRHQESQTCNITLNEFSELDVGKWQCSCRLKAGDFVMESQGIWLSLMRSPSGPEIRKGNTAVSEIMLNYAAQIPSLSCVTQGGSPAASLWWVLDGSKVKGFQQVIDHGNNSRSTILYWNSKIPMSSTSNSVVLQCISTHPNYDVKYCLAEVIVTLAKTPEDPMILFYQRPVVSQPMTISVDDLGGLKCVCANGNPVPALRWQVNALSMKSNFIDHFIEPGLHTAELPWNPGNNQHLAMGPLLMECIVSHPTLHNNRRAVLRIILQNSEQRARIQQLQSSNHFYMYWVGIVVFALLLISVVLAALFYPRLRQRSSSAERANIFLSIQSLFASCLQNARNRMEEPLMQYSALEGDQNGCDATIICEENFN